MKFGSLLAFAGGMYGCLCLGMFSYQRHLQYVPTGTVPPVDTAGVPDLSEVTLKTEDGLALLSWYTPPSDDKLPVVVFFHGNAGHIGERDYKARRLKKNGYGVLMVEYRGYGGNSGAPSQAGLLADAEAALDFLDGKGISAPRRVYYGESLGTGVATLLAARHEPAALVLECPFSSAVDVARGAYWYLPVDFLMRDPFPSRKVIGDIRAPLLQLHGKADKVVLFALSRKLFKAASEPKTFRAYPEGHHMDLYDHGAGEEIIRWLDALFKTEKKPA